MEPNLDVPLNKRERPVRHVGESWVHVEADSDFSLANIPFGIVSTTDDPAPHAAIAIGDYVLDLKVLLSRLGEDDVFGGTYGFTQAFSQPTLNAFADMGREMHAKVRTTLQQLLTRDLHKA